MLWSSVERLRGTLLFAQTLSVAGLAFLGHAWRGFAAARRGADWPVTMGRIDRATASRAADSGGYVTVLYRYSVGGREYNSDNVWPGESASHTLPGDVDHVLGKYFAGMEVGVHYDPARPEVSFLEHRRTPTTLAVGAIGAVLLLAGLIVLLLGVLP